MAHQLSPAFHGQTVKATPRSTCLRPPALVGLQTQGFGVAPQLRAAAEEAAGDVLLGHQHAVPAARVAATWRSYGDHMEIIWRSGEAFSIWVI